eukprot:649682-Pelagomonas_calceolata.AAC.1
MAEILEAGLHLCVQRGTSIAEGQQETAPPRFLFRVCMVRSKHRAQPRPAPGANQSGKCKAPWSFSCLSAGIILHLLLIQEWMKSILRSLERWHHCAFSFDPRLNQ